MKKYLVISFSGLLSLTSGLMAMEAKNTFSSLNDFQRFLGSVNKLNITNITLNLGQNAIKETEDEKLRVE